MMTTEVGHRRLRWSLGVCFGSNFTSLEMDASIG
jgi:hypothetical protein